MLLPFISIFFSQFPDFKSNSLSRISQIELYPGPSFKKKSTRVVTAFPTVDLMTH